MSEICTKGILRRENDKVFEQQTKKVKTKKKDGRKKKRLR